MSLADRQSSLDVDLATLREMIRSSRPHHGSAEAHDAWEQAVDEAYLTLARVEAEVARLREAELNGRIDLERYEHLHNDYKAMLKRAEAAERELARLQEGLRRIADDIDVDADYIEESLQRRNEARALLADQQPDTPVEDAFVLWVIPDRGGGWNRRGAAASLEDAERLRKRLYRQLGDVSVRVLRKGEHPTGFSDVTQRQDIPGKDGAA